MKEVIEIFEKLKNTSSLNEKKAIIAANKDNELFKKCLVWLLDGNCLSGISTKKINKKVYETDYFMPSIEEVLKYFEHHNTGTDDDIARIQSFIRHQPEECQNFYTDFLTKSYKIGCDSKVVNAVIPGLIPTWDVQQAYPLSEKNEPKAGEWFSLSQKLNGNNMGYLDGKCISRQGKEFKGLEHIITDIQKLSFKDMFFNGELIRKNTDGLSDDQNFQIGTGIINSDDMDKNCIEFIIYEMIPKNEFIVGESKLKYKDRIKNYLVPLENEINSLGLTNIRVVGRVYEGTDKAVITTELDKANALNWEGLMLNKNTVWKNKRNNGILKVKSFKHCDVICKDIIEGSGKYKGTLGNIVCDYKGYDLGVGSGFTDEQRKYYWENRDEIIGKVVTVKYKSETQNKDGGLSVQFPTFVIVREDGKEVSYNG